MSWHLPGLTFLPLLVVEATSLNSNFSHEKPQRSSNLDLYPVLGTVSACSSCSFNAELSTSCCCFWCWAGSPSLGVTPPPFTFGFGAADLFEVPKTMPRYLLSSLKHIVFVMGCSHPLWHGPILLLPDFSASSRTPFYSFGLLSSFLECLKAQLGSVSLRAKAFCFMWVFLWLFKALDWLKVFWQVGQE